MSEPRYEKKPCQHEDDKRQIRPDLTSFDFHVDRRHHIPYILPQIIRTQVNEILLPEVDMKSFIHYELDCTRLNRVQDFLWLAGRQENIRPLHRQVMIGRTIVVTEQVDLHMLWQEDRIYLKPLAAWMFDHRVFSDAISVDQVLLASFLGFLKSYVLLISRESDHRVAIDAHLLPEQITWDKWILFVKNFLPYMNGDAIAAIIKQHCPRYRYAELRLNRVNLIYRLRPAFKLRYLSRGYFYGYRNYHQLVERNFAWILVVFIYVTIILTAMQAGLATNILRDSKPFNQATFGFAVFAIVLPVFAFMVWFMVSLCLTMYHTSAAAIYDYHQNREREAVSFSRTRSHA